MNIYFLFIIFCALTILSYRLLNQDIMSPSVFLGISYILAIIAAIYNVRNWEIDLGFQTCLILISAYVFFLIIEIIIKTMWIGKTTNFVTALEYIEVSKVTYWGCILFSLIISFLYFKEAYRIAVENGYVGVGNFLTYYRKAASYGVLTLEEDVNQVVNQLFKLLTVNAYIFMYIFLNNYLAMCENGKWKKLLWSRIPIYIYFVSSILTANRLQYIRFAVASFIMFYLLWNYQNGWKKKISGKLIVWGVGCLVILLIVFVLLRGVVGRVSTQSPIDYITRYAGASIELFDQYLETPANKTEYVGGETFHGVYTGLRKLGLSDYNNISHLEFRRLGSYGYSSNTYTALRRYYHDFGIAGIYLFQMVLSLFYNIFYYFHLRTASRRTQFKEILYAFLFYAIPMHSINEIFFSSYFSIATVVYIIEFWVMWRIYTRVNIVLGK